MKSSSLCSTTTRFRNTPFVEKVHLASRTSWSGRAFRDLRDILARESPDVAHFHNTFPLISPSAYYACSAANIPVVQTLHNYRLLCPSGNLFRKGSICEECISHSFCLVQFLSGVVAITTCGLRAPLWQGC